MERSRFGLATGFSGNVFAMSENLLRDKVTCANIILSILKDFREFFIRKFCCNTAGITKATGFHEFREKSERV